MFNCYLSQIQLYCAGELPSKSVLLLGAIPQVHPRHLSYPLNHNPDPQSYFLANYCSLASCMWWCISNHWQGPGSLETCNLRNTCKVRTPWWHLGLAILSCSKLLASHLHSTTHGHLGWGYWDTPHEHGATLQPGSLHKDWTWRGNLLKREAVLTRPLLSLCRIIDTLSLFR